MRSWGDEHVESDAELRDIARLHGTRYPDVSDRDLEHDETLAAADRRADKAPAAHLALAYTERPTDRERAAHRDEAKARRDTRPTGGHVERIARTAKCNCGARETGYRHPGHRYKCPRYSSHREAA